MRTLGAKLNQTAWTAEIGECAIFYTGFLACAYSANNFECAHKCGSLILRASVLVAKLAISYLNF